MLEAPQGCFHALPEQCVLFGHQGAAPADPSRRARPSLVLPSVASTSLPFVCAGFPLCSAEGTRPLPHRSPLPVCPCSPSRAVHGMNRGDKTLPPAAPWRPELSLGCSAMSGL